MNKLLLLLHLFLISCSSDPIYSLQVINPYDRVTFTEIALPGYTFSFNDPADQTFILDSGMPSGLDDIRVTLTHECSAGGATYNRDVFVNFIEDKITTITVDRVNTCSPQFIVSYE